MVDQVTLKFSSWELVNSAGPLVGSSCKKIFQQLLQFCFDFSTGQEHSILIVCPSCSVCLFLAWVESHPELPGSESGELEILSSLQPPCLCRIHKDLFDKI